MASRKRPGDAGDSPQRKHARHDKSNTHPSSERSAGPSSSFTSAARSYQSTPPTPLSSSNRYAPRSSWVADDEVDVVDLTQDDDSTPSLELYGTLDNKIVGVRYYNGVVTPGEMVLCRREPGNPYDGNAIRVDNVMRTQIGHIPRTVAKQLAPFIDQNDIVLEGVATGYKGAFDCPIRLYIYGTSDPERRKELEAKLKAAKLLKAAQLKVTRLEAEARRKASEPGLKSGSSLAGLPQEEDEGQNVPVQQLLGASQMADTRAEDFLKDFAMDEEALARLPMAEQPQDLASQLLPYQLQGLSWMTAKEAPQLPAPGSKDVVQLWRRDNSGNFFNLASGFTSISRPRLLSGGILADDMGLGKTLQIISLILSTKGDGPTLIIAPKGVMSNWEEQILRHVKPDHMPSVLRYHSVAKTGKCTKSDFLKHDIVITSYGKLVSDFQAGKRTGIFSPDWRRVVLDEGHVIRNSKTTTAKAVCSLEARSRWVLTGTPIINHREDFQSILQFLRISGGIEDVLIFKTAISRPLDTKPTTQEGAKEYNRAKSLLQALFHDLCLRRMKDMKFVDLKLPNKTEYIHRVAFTKEEKAKYDAMLSEAQGALEQYQKNSEKEGKLRFTNVLERLLRLRQMCCHWTLCKDRVKDVLAVLGDQGVVQFTKANLEILQKALALGCRDGEECSICFESIDLHQPIITACKHMFGKDCILEWIDTGGGGNKKGTCPQCRAQLTPESLVELSLETEAPVEFDAETRSSKTEELLKIVELSLKDPKSKIVIFSQWTSFLDIIQHVVEEAKFGCSRIDGKMSVEKRDRAVAALYDDPNTRVMLASLSACSVGLNLVAADTVILADSWWAPAIEDQAIDRVHRLGQTRETKVWRLVMEGSVEERVLQIQAKKRKLVSMAFKEKKRGAKAQESTSADVKKLLYGVPEEGSQ
ncbi:hypothetical protein DL767_009029 [Monosporascus sp. MG133]|nr:hypothetical protein DL767_009029 [Monosporascus sp. MG133]